MSLPVEKLQVGDILLKRGGDIGAEIIRALTADGEAFAESYSHVGIYAGGGKVWDATFPAGVALRDLDYGDFDVYRLQQFAKLYPFVGSYDQENILRKQNALLDFCKSKEGTRYAIEELLKQGLALGLHIPTHIHFGANGVECSYFVAEAYRAIGYPLTNKPLPVPNDLGWSVVVAQVQE